MRTPTMGEPTTQTIGDYYRPADVTHVSLGFVPANPINLNMKYFMLSDIRYK